MPAIAAMTAARTTLSILARRAARATLATHSAPAALARLALLATLAALTALAATLRLNTTPSIPLGLYRLSRRPPAAGDLVLACPPPWAARLALARGYLAAGSCPGGTRLLGKLLLAGPGARLTLTAAGLILAGRLLPLSRPATADTRGRPLPHAAYGTWRLPPGTAWLYAPHPRSFDSRVFGPVPLAALRGVLLPVWTRGHLRLPRLPRSLPETP